MTTSLLVVVTEHTFATRFEATPDGQVTATCFTGKRRMLSLSHPPFADMDSAARWVDDRGWPTPARYQTMPKVRGY